MLPIHRVKNTIFNYDEIPAGYYHQAMLSGGQVQRFWHREKFREVARRIGSEDRVLDLGCGPGSFLHVLSEEKPAVSGVGVDIASRQIDYAQKFFRENRQGARIEFHTWTPRALTSLSKPLPSTRSRASKSWNISIPISRREF